jgi:anti-anti-sigma factor
VPDTPLLRMQVEKQPDKNILHCAGKVLIETGAQFSHAVRELIAEGKPIYVDLADVTQVDSVGIGNFVSLWATARKSGVQLKFTQLNDRIRDLFEITRLQDMFAAEGAG